MLNAHLSMREHVSSDRFDMTKPESFVQQDNSHNDAYMKIVGRYADERERGERNIDQFAAAYSALILGIDREESDPLGDVYMSAISFGEHGQYFTPQPIAELIVNATGDIHPGQTVLDPACGSGVMLIAAGKKNPDAILCGVDLDERCAKMATLNLALRELTGHITCGDALTGEAFTQWDISRGWVTRNDNPAPLERSGPAAPKQLTLL
jgi:type I restriction-modification system DNA methylase subunit